MSELIAWACGLIMGSLGAIFMMCIFITGNRTRPFPGATSIRELTKKGQ